MKQCSFSWPVVPVFHYLLWLSCQFTLTCCACCTGFSRPVVPVFPYLLCLSYQFTLTCYACCTGFSRPVVPVFPYLLCLSYQFTLTCYACCTGFSRPVVPVFSNLLCLLYHALLLFLSYQFFLTCCTRFSWPVVPVFPNLLRLSYQFFLNCYTCHTTFSQPVVWVASAASPVRGPLGCRAPVSASAGWQIRPVHLRRRESWERLGIAAQPTCSAQRIPATKDKKTNYLLLF